MQKTDDKAGKPLRSTPAATSTPNNVKAPTVNKPEKSNKEGKQSNAVLANNNAKPTSAETAKNGANGSNAGGGFFGVLGSAFLFAATSAGAFLFPSGLKQRTLPDSKKETEKTKKETKQETAKKETPKKEAEATKRETKQEAPKQETPKKAPASSTPTGDKVKADTAAKSPAPVQKTIPLDKKTTPIVQGLLQPTTQASPAHATPVPIADYMKTSPATPTTPPAASAVPTVTPPVSPIRSPLTPVVVPAKPIAPAVSVPNLKPAPVPGKSPTQVPSPSSPATAPGTPIAPVIKPLPTLKPKDVMPKVTPPVRPVGSPLKAATASPIPKATANVVAAPKVPTPSKPTVIATLTTPPVPTKSVPDFSVKKKKSSTASVSTRRYVPSISNSSVPSLNNVPSLKNASITYNGSGQAMDPVISCFSNLPTSLNEVTTEKANVSESRCTRVTFSKMQTVYVCESYEQRLLPKTQRGPPDEWRAYGAMRKIHEIGGWVLDKRNRNKKEPVYRFVAKGTAPPKAPVAEPIMSQKEFFVRRNFSAPDRRTPS